MVKGSRKKTTVAMILVALAIFFIKELYEPNKASYNSVSAGADSVTSFEATVSRVIDGDTISIESGDDNVTVRFIGVDAPEKDECYYKESSTEMKTMVDGKRVLVVTDPTQDKYDMYKRLLAYVYLEDGTLLNQKMIEVGAAKEYTYTHRYQFQNEFRAAERLSAEGNIGLWGACAD